MEPEACEGVAVRTFSEVFLGEQVHFYVLRLHQSFLLWAGCGSSFQSLAVAMKTRFDSEPLCTQVLGDVSSQASSLLAKRLVQKSGCQCFVSLNVPDSSLHPLIEEHLLQSIENNPKSFFM